MDLLLVLFPIVIMGLGLLVFSRGYRSAKKRDQNYTIASALENPIPAEIEAKRLIMEYAEALTGRYDPAHKANHTMQWFKKLDEHVQRNQYYYQNEVTQDEPIEQLSEIDTNVVSLFDKNK